MIRNNKTKFINMLLTVKLLTKTLKTSWKNLISSLVSFSSINKNLCLFLDKTVQS